MTTPDQSGDHAPQRAPHMQALEAQLAALRPRGDRLDRERLMFLAGQAYAQAAVPRSTAARARWAWPMSFGAIGGAAAASVAMLIVRPAAWSPPASNGVFAGATVSVGRDPPARAMPDRLLTAGLSLARIEKLLADDHGTRPVGEFHGAAGDSPVDPGSVLSARSFEQVL